jgi:hypothetical protein
MSPSRKYRSATCIRTLSQTAGTSRCLPLWPWTWTKDMTDWPGLTWTYLLSKLVKIIEALPTGRILCTIGSTLLSSRRLCRCASGCLLTDANGVWDFEIERMTDLSNAARFRQPTVVATAFGVFGTPSLEPPQPIVKNGWNVNWKTFDRGVEICDVTNSTRRRYGFSLDFWEAIRSILRSPATLSCSARRTSLG